MKKGEILLLNNVLFALKMGKVSKEGMFALLNDKIALKKYIEEINDAEKTARSEFKPLVKESEEMKEERKRKQIEFLDNFLDKEVSVKLEKISQEDFYQLVKENDLTIQQMEALNIIVKGGAK